MGGSVSHRADRRALPLADRHDNHQKVGMPWLVPPGCCLVHLTEDADAITQTVAQTGQGESRKPGPAPTFARCRSTTKTATDFSRIWIAACGLDSEADQGRPRPDRIRARRLPKKSARIGEPPGAFSRQEDVRDAHAERRRQNLGLRRTK